MREAILSSSSAVYLHQQPSHHHLVETYHVLRWGLCKTKQRLAICSQVVRQHPA